MKEENEEKNEAESFILQRAHLSEGKLFTNNDLKHKWTKMGISSIYFGNAFLRTSESLNNKLIYNSWYQAIYRIHKPLLLLTPVAVKWTSASNLLVLALVHM